MKAYSQIFVSKGLQEGKAEGSAVRIFWLMSLDMSSVPWLGLVTCPLENVNRVTLIA